MLKPLQPPRLTVRTLLVIVLVRRDLFGPLSESSWELFRMHQSAPDRSLLDSSLVQTMFQSLLPLQRVSH